MQDARAAELLVVGLGVARAHERALELEVVDQRKSFFTDSGVGLRGFLEFFPGGTWGEMVTWNPVSRRSSYIYECVPQYVYVGVIDGNKFTGVWKPTDQPNQGFIGVFSHTLQEFFAEPGPLAPPCE